ncbi:MAG: prepilin-type N-terminal cleavage/methylation domain-containing protein [Gaiellaceae bacterium]
MDRLRLRLAREEGFTLIELLVVLLIIGILLSIAIPSYLGFQRKAEQVAAASDVRTAVPDAEAFYSDNNAYTTLSIANLQTYDSGLLAYSSTTPGVKTAKGGATKYCISADDSGWYAHIVGPGGQVVSAESSDFCATWVAS